MLKLLIYLNVLANKIGIKIKFIKAIDILLNRKTRLGRD
jgi:hypothetical protein